MDLRNGSKLPMTSDISNQAVEIFDKIGRFVDSESLKGVFTWQEFSTASGTNDGSGESESIDGEDVSGEYISSVTIENQENLNPLTVLDMTTQITAN